MSHSETTSAEASVVVVTGATAGVGRATARAFAASGHDVALLARGRAGLEAVAAEVELAGRRALPLSVDVADWETVRSAAARVESELGPISTWVNNAMTTVFAPVSLLSAAEIRRATEVTYLGQVHGALAALEHMRPRDRGTIVSVGSALAYRGLPLQAAYCASKFAVRGFMDSLRCELLHDRSGVRVCQVHLPAINTPQFGWCRNRMPREPQPVAPVYQPERAARAILAAASTRPRHKIVGRWNWLVVQANKVMPDVLDHFAASTAYDSQQTAQPARPTDGNLEEPRDDHEDAGARGRFSDRATGMADPSFLRSLPGLGRDLARAGRDRLSAS